MTLSNDCYDVFPNTKGSSVWKCASLVHRWTNAQILLDVVFVWGKQTRAMPFRSDALPNHCNQFNLRDRVSFIHPRLSKQEAFLQHTTPFLLSSSLKQHIKTYIMPVAKVSPSMLSCDFAYLAAEAKRMEKNGAEWLHLGKNRHCFRVFKIRETDTLALSYL